MAETKKAPAKKPASKKSESTEVATKDNTALADPNAQALLDGLLDEQEEVMSRDDMEIPFLQILQPQSPQVMDGSTEQIEGAKPGMILNTVTGEIFPARTDQDEAGIRVIGIHYKRSFIEWIPRTKGGGFVDEYDVATGLSAKTLRNDNNLDIIQEGSPVGTPGNQLSDTHTHAVFFLDDDNNFSPCMMSMASTQQKPSRQWNNMIANTRLRGKSTRMLGVWRVTTVRRQNEQGFWYVWKFEREALITELDNAADILGAGKALRDAIEGGEVSADHAKMGEENTPVQNTGAGDVGDDDLDEEIPF